MESKFDLIKPSLYKIKNSDINAHEIYFSLIKDKDLIPVSRAIDSIVKDYFGQLKVKKSDIETSNSQISENYTEPLEDYIKKIENNGKIPSIGNWYNSFFGLSPILYANTKEILWSERDELKRRLNNFEEFLEQQKSDCMVIDEKLTKEAMNQKLNELSTEPGSVAYQVECGAIGSPFSENSKNSYLVGRISLYPNLESSGKIRRFQRSLIRKLNEYDGPRLSFEAPKYMHQSKNLEDHSQNLIEAYGDVLGKPFWRDHLLQTSE